MKTISEVKDKSNKSSFWKRKRAKFLFASGVLLIILLGYSIYASRKAAEWNRYVHAYLKNADELQVFSFEARRSKTDEDGIVLEISDKDEVAEVLQHVKVKRIHITCECSDDVGMYFYREGRQIGYVGIHHGKNLRWHEGYLQQKHGVLSREDREFLLNWLYEHGVPDLKEKYGKDHQTTGNTGHRGEKKRRI